MLKSHMRQLRGKLGVFEKKQRTVEHIQVGAAFQSILAQLWRAYLPLQQALAEDDFAQATQEVAGFQKAYAAANDQSLPDRERTAWNKEKATMLKQLDAMQAAPDIESLRTAFAAFSDELGVLIKTFGSDQLGDVYELHCPMALDEQGAIWFQNQESTKNPYYGSAMLECSDRVELIFPAAPQGSDMKAHEGHSHNE
jgi:Cu(I)/Ag(I) efflux system membrane fusion protein